MSETTQKVAELKAVVKSLKPTGFAQASEFVIPFNHVECPDGHTLEDMLKPEYWCHVAKKMQGRGRILVDAEDGSWSAQLKIHRASDLQAVVSLEWKAEHGAKAKERAVSKADEYDVAYKGTRAKWRITRKADGQTISDGWESEEIARGELRGYLQAQAA